MAENDFEAEIAALRILLIEDHGFQRWTLQRMLQDLGAQYVYSAEDGQAALDLMESLEETVDLVVSDLDMPGMDGMEFIRRVGEERHNISMIVLSAHDPALLSTVESMASAYGVRLLAAIHKPATPQKLRQAIESRRPAAQERAPLIAGLEFSAADLRAAIEQGHVVPFFQPKVEVPTGKVVGAEVLARWHHEEKGAIPPKHFIPAMEAHGLVTLLTHTILHKACDGYARWRQRAATAKLCVNVSVNSLAEVGMADRLLATADQHGIAPRDLVFEVTESAAMTELGKVLENLTRLRMRGAGLSIDDYGTGYSSMQQLSRIPFTELKIDQSFVLKAHDHAASRAMLESSLELAAKLDIVAVAEGVETDREWRIVRDMGCHAAQGFHIGRPMSLVDFVAWISQAP